MVRSADIPRLIAELDSPDLLRRETAVARLALAGSRAVAPLIDKAADARASSATRVAAFAALEASATQKGVVAAASGALTGDDEEVAVAAIACLAQAAAGGGPASLAAFEQLAGIALAADAAVTRRLAALAALDGLPEHHVRPVYEALRDDPKSRVVARVVRRQAGLVLPLEELVERGLPDDPALVAAVVREEADQAKLTSLRRLIEVVRARERSARESDRRQWMAVRGQVHQHLAARGSRIAAYDLRETLEQMNGPVPVGFVAAAAAIGDAACLNPLARAWLDAGSAERWWRDHLAEAFGSIARRIEIRRSDPRLLALLKRSPAAAPLVALARKG